MTIRELCVLAAIDERHLRALLEQLPRDNRRGRPWSRSRTVRVLVTCAALRTNLTLRELSTVVGFSKSTVHRIVTDMTSRLASLLCAPPPDRRWSWVIDGTLIPTRDRRVAAKSKNYRYSSNAQVLIRRTDRRVIAVASGGPEIATIQFITEAPLWNFYASNTVACSPMVAIEVYPSL